MHSGGAETMLMNIYRKINKSKMQFDFFVSTKYECFYDNEIISLGGTIYRTVTKSTQPLKYCWDLWHLLRQKRYPIIHVHASNAMSAIPITIGKVSGIPKRIVHSHTSNASGKKMLHYVMRPILNAMATDKYSCSDVASNWMFGKYQKEIVVINNPIDCNLFKFDKDARGKMRTSMGLENEIIYVHVGGFSKQKNHEFLIEIFSEIRKKNQNSVLLLVGSGELFPKIKEKVSNQNLQNSIRFLGIRSDVSSILKGCDAFLLPSLFEGLPLTLIEAQSTGLKCYISDVITQQVAVTDLIKMISLEKSAKEWADIILKDINRPVDKKRCNEIVRKLFDSRLIATQFAEKYYKLKDKQ